MNEIEYQEGFENLLDMTKNMVVEPKRNELCYCMSNKKYKKCCMSKERDVDIKFIDSKEFHVVPDTRPEFFQYDMSDEDYQIAKNCYEMLLTGGIEENPKALEALDDLLKKYPRHRVLHTASPLRHAMKRENKALKKAIQKNLEKFPDSKINLLLLKYHEYDSYGSQFFLKIREKLEKAPPEDPELNKIYDRKQIPLTEFLLTLSLQIYENLFQEKLHKAMILKDMMTYILEKMGWEDHFLLMRMEQILVLAKIARRLKIFLANSTVKETNQLSNLENVLNS